jgi:hypothetical protein
MGQRIQTDFIKLGAAQHDFHILVSSTVNQLKIGNSRYRITLDKKGFSSPLTSQQHL